MKIITLPLLLLALVACGADDDNDEEIQMEQEETSGKTLFDQWVRSDNRFILDLSGGSFDQPRSNPQSLDTGETCSCTIYVSGTEQAGTIEIYACAYSGGGLGNPDCDALWENGRRPYEYIKVHSMLKLCEAPGVCSTYK